MRLNCTRVRLFTFSLAIIFLTSFESCSKVDLETKSQPAADNFSAQVAVDWMEQTRQLVKSEGKNPPQASRIYAYAAIAIYESVLPGLKGYQSLAHQVPGLVNLPNVRGFEQLDYTVAVNEAMYQVSLKLLGTLKADNLKGIELLHREYLDGKVTSVSNAIIQNSTEFGKMVALAVLNRANGDNFSETRSMNYNVPSSSSNAWAPTDNTNLTPLEPFGAK